MCSFLPQFLFLILMQTASEKGLVQERNWVVAHIQYILPSRPFKMGPFHLSPVNIPSPPHSPDPAFAFFGYSVCIAHRALLRGLLHKCLCIWLDLGSPSSTPFCLVLILCSQQMFNKCLLSKSIFFFFNFILKSLNYLRDFPLFQVEGTDMKEI